MKQTNNKQKHPKKSHALDVFTAPRTFSCCYRTLPVRRSTGHCQPRVKGHPPHLSGWWDSEEKGKWCGVPKILVGASRGRKIRSLRSPSLTEEAGGQPVLHESLLDKPQARQRKEERENCLPSRGDVNEWCRAGYVNEEARQETGAIHFLGVKHKGLSWKESGTSSFDNAFPLSNNTQDSVLSAK